MKKQFILSMFFLLSVISVESQTFTADEMISQIAKCKKFDCINDFLITKKFRLVKSTNMSWAMAYDFGGDINSAEKCPDALTSEFVSVMLYEDKRREITYSTSSITCYQKLKDGFLQKGFEYKEEHISEDPTNAKEKLYQGVVSTYRSIKYPKIILSISTLYKSYKGNKSTDYEFKVEKYGAD
jgi:hypothetical protein